MSNLEGQLYYLCNACGAIAPERQQAPLKVAVRVVDPASGDETERPYTLCMRCQNKLRKGQAIMPGE